MWGPLLLTPIPLWMILEMTDEIRTRQDCPVVVVDQQRVVVCDGSNDPPAERYVVRLKDIEYWLLDSGKIGDELVRLEFPDDVARKDVETALCYPNPARARLLHPRQCTNALNDDGLSLGGDNQNGGHDKVYATTSRSRLFRV